MNKKRRLWNLVILIALLTFAALTAGCRQQPSSKEKVDSRTREITLERWGHTYNCIVYYYGGGHGSESLWCERVAD